MDNNDPYAAEDWIELSRVILDSYRHWLKADLIDRSGSRLEQSKRMYKANCVVVAHGTQADPILCYANQAALELWETDLQTILKMPSRMTAEQHERSDRSRMLKLGLDHGYIEDYSGVRLSTSGRRFYIQQATVWTLLADDGSRAGQAATFSDWNYIEE